MSRVNDNKNRYEMGAGDGIQKTIEDHIESTPNHHGIALNNARVIETFSNSLQERNEQLEKFKWIKCSDRLPENGQEVLVFDDFEQIDFASFWHNDYWKTITHWMPLPERPE